MNSTTSLPQIDSSPPPRSLIQHLIAERSATDADEMRSRLAAFDDVRTVSRDLDPLRTDEIYLFGIAVGVGVGKLTIDCGEIELNSAVSEAIAEADGRWTITLPIFAELTKKGTQLSTRRRRIQEKYLRFARPYWYVSAADMPALRDEIFQRIDTDKPQQQGLLPLAEDLKAEALDMYDEAFEGLLHKVEDIGVKAGLSSDRIEQLLQKAADQFPTRQEITSNFGVSLEGPVKIPSLVEQATTNAELAEQLAREQTAINQQLELEMQESLLHQSERLQREELRERERLQTRKLQADRRLQQEEIDAKAKAQAREQQAIADLQQFWIRSVQESFAVGIKQAQDDGYALLAEILGVIETVDQPGKVHGNLRKRLDTKLRELQTAVNAIASVNEGEFDPSLERFAERTRQLAVLTSSNVSPDTLQQRLQAMRTEMTDELHQVFGSPKRGHRALAQWLIEEDDEE